MLVRCLGRSEVPVCWFLRHLSTKKQHFLSPSFVVAFLVPDTFYLLVICLKFYLKYFLFFFFLICVQEVEQNKQTNKTVFQHLFIFLSYLSKRQVTQPAVYRETHVLQESFTSFSSNSWACACECTCAEHFHACSLPRACVPTPKERTHTFT